MSAASRSARTIQFVSVPITHDDLDVSVGDGVASLTDAVQLSPQCSPVPQRAPELSIPKYDPSKSCAPLVIDRTRKFSHSESPPQIATPSPLEAATQHPDMLAMLQGLDAEFVNWIQDSTYPEGDVGKHDFLAVCSTTPVPSPSPGPHALESFGDIAGSSTPQPIAFPVEGYYSPPREPPSTSLAAGDSDPVVQRPSTPNVSESPPPRASPRSGRISFKDFFKKSRSNNTQMNPSCRSHRRLWSRFRLLAVA